MATNDETPKDQAEPAPSGDPVGPEEDGGGELKGEGLDPLADEMLKMMGEEGEDNSAAEDVDRLMELEMLRAMAAEGGTSGGGTGAGAAGLEIGKGGDGGGTGLPANIARLMDVTLTVTVELGRTEETMEAVMNLGEQSLVELDKHVGDPVDVLVNGKLYARGEVVIVAENFGVRITELLSTMNQL
jgi:flagellar motor switch protein FliN